VVNSGSAVEHQALVTATAVLSA